MRGVISSWNKGIRVKVDEVKNLKFDNQDKKERRIRDLEQYHFEIK